MAASSCRFPLRSSLSARRVLRNLVAFALLYGAGLAAVWGFSLLGVSTLVAFPVFVLGVLIASLETDSGLWGAALGVAYLLSYDFLFTAPLFTLKVLSRTDVAALAIFLVVSLIMGVITHRMSRQVQAAERTACALGRLNRLSVGLLESSTPQAACSFAQEFLTRVLRRPVTITLGEPPAAGSAAARDCYERRSPTGYGEPGWRDATEKYLPLGMKGRLYGVVAIDCSSGDVDSGSLSLVSQLARHFHHERIRNCGHDGSFLAASKRPVLATPAVARRQARGSVGHPRRLGWSRSPGRLVATDL